MAPSASAAARSPTIATAPGEPDIFNCACASTIALVSLAGPAERSCGAPCTRGAAASTARSVSDEPPRGGARSNQDQPEPALGWEQEAPALRIEANVVALEELSSHHVLFAATRHY